MKKFIMCCPFQPEQNLKAIKYESPENKSIVYDKETRFPIIPLINSYAKKDDKIQIILICSDHPNVMGNKPLLNSEISEICREKGIEYSIKEIITDYDETIDTQLKLFTDIIENTKDNDELYACITYGKKPMTVIEMMAINYAYRVLSNVKLGCIVYGQWDMKTQNGHIFDISPLFYMDEIVNNLAAMKVRDPLETIKQIMSL